MALLPVYTCTAVLIYKIGVGAALAGRRKILKTIWRMGRFTLSLGRIISLVLCPAGECRAVLEESPGVIWYSLPRSDVVSNVSSEWSWIADQAGSIEASARVAHTNNLRPWLQAILWLDQLLYHKTGGSTIFTRFLHIAEDIGCPSYLFLHPLRGALLARCVPACYQSPQLVGPSWVMSEKNH